MSNPAQALSLASSSFNITARAGSTLSVEERLSVLANHRVSDKKRRAVLASLIPNISSFRS